MGESRFKGGAATASIVKELVKIFVASLNAGCPRIPSPLQRCKLSPYAAEFLATIVVVVEGLSYGGSVSCAARDAPLKSGAYRGKKEAQEKPGAMSCDWQLRDCKKTHPQTRKKI